MFTRRKFMLGSILGTSYCAWGLPPGEFWDDKQPSEWSEKEVQRLLTKSPWAKETNPQMDFSSRRGGGMMGPGGMGPPPGMGPGGPEGRGGRGGPGGLNAVVRWESAAPVKDARKKKLPRDPAGGYVISVSGLPMLSDLGATLEASGLDALKKATQLMREGKPPVNASYITMPFDESGIILFYFAAGSDPITAGDKQVTFQTKIQQFGLQVKFAPKEMMYRGNLAL